MAYALSLCGLRAVAQSSLHLPPELSKAQQALLGKHFAEAKAMFSAYLKSHPGNIDAEEGVGDSELGLHEYETAEMQYRAVTASQPEMWNAHKNLVIVEAGLGRWEEFDRERAVLRGARERGEPGISKRESDVIDSFDVQLAKGQPAQHWVVREYFEPAGRSLTRYNFERFGDDGRVKEYVSLESAAAAEQALARNDVRIGIDTADQQIDQQVKDFALNWYTGRAHGTIAQYPKGEPPYDKVRAAVQHWLRIQRAG
jgi:hypothetical protein